MRTVRATVREFWGFVKEADKSNPDLSPCWEWNGPTAYNGYMAFRSVLAHRAAATIYCGKIPSSVSPRCDNKKCVRLHHLAITTPEYDDDCLTPLHQREEVIKKVLAARGTTRYTIEQIREATGYNIETIRKVLRLAPLYDLLDDIEKIKASGGTVQTQPNPTKVLARA